MASSDPRIDPQTNAEWSIPISIKQPNEMLATKPGEIAWRIEVVPHQSGADGEFYESGVGNPADARRALLEAARQIDGWLETLDEAADLRAAERDRQARLEKDGPTHEQIASKARQQIVPVEVVEQVKRRSVMVRVDGEPVALEPRSYNALEILDATEALRHMTSESYDLGHIDRDRGYPEFVLFTRGVPWHDQEFVSVLRVGQMD